nr:MAG TPA: hypothetical protein [Caudoviricetes sp.]
MTIYSSPRYIFNFLFSRRSNKLDLHIITLIV